MPNSAIIAAALTDHSARPYSLFLNGLDILGSGIGTFGVDLESISVTEVGPGGVSSMEFVLGDPSGTTTIPDGAVLRFQWNTPDVPLFLGWVDTYGIEPAYGGQGRVITIQGIGIEAQLDNLIVIDEVDGSKDLLGGTGGYPGQVAWMGMTAGVANYQTSGQGAGIALSSQSQPISGYVRAVGDATGFSNGNWVAANESGSSLRRAIELTFARAASLDPQPASSGASQARIQFTMDFYGGLRMWNDYPLAIPSDYTNLTINDVYAGPIVAENLEYAVDPSQVIHEVYVKGSSAANSGWFSDGTGIRGKQQYYSDATNITTPALAAQAAQSILQANNNQVRGSFDLTDFTPVATIHTGSFVTITDAAVGQSAQSYRIMEIEKTFNASGRQNWHVSFGSLAPDVTRFTRRLTYTVRGVN